MKAAHTMATMICGCESEADGLLRASLSRAAEVVDQNISRITGLADVLISRRKMSGDGIRAAISSIPAGSSDNGPATRAVNQLFASAGYMTRAEPPRGARKVTVVAGNETIGKVIESGLVDYKAIRIAGGKRTKVGDLFNDWRSRTGDLTRLSRRSVCQTGAHRRAGVA